MSEQTPNPDQDQPSTLDALYGHLGDALSAEEQLHAKDQEALTQIESRQGELQGERAKAETAGDTRQLQAIDSELRELDQAYQTIRSQLGDADQPDDQAADQ